MPSENTVVTITSPTLPGNKGDDPTKAEAGDVSNATSATTPTTPSFDPTEYVQKQRVTKTIPPKPANNPLQFIQIKPCNLYQSAQDQLRKAEEVKKAQVTKKEEAEDWQGNLDSWKSSRRKRVEHIIERVVEVKKLEIEEHDRTRKKSKTFSEMMEERGGRRKISLPVYTVEESNDLSDLGIGNSVSGKSSLSDDFDNHSVISDIPDMEKSSDADHNEGNGTYRQNLSSPGYETCSSTAPTISPDPQDETRCTRTYQERELLSNNSKPFSPRLVNGSGSEPNKLGFKRTSVSKIEDRLVNFELKSTSVGPTDDLGNGVAKKDLPKVDITKRRELFEKESTPERAKRSSGDFSETPIMSIKDRLWNLEKQKEEPAQSQTTTNRLSGDITSIKERLWSLEKESGQPVSAAPKFDIPLGGSIKDRLSSLQSSVTTTTTTMTTTASMASVPGGVAEVAKPSPKSAVVVGMAKKQLTDEDQVIEVETLKIEIEQINLTPAKETSLEKGIPDAVQELTTIIQEVKVSSHPPTAMASSLIREKDEYREITDEDLFGGTEIDVDAEVEIDNLQSDISVLEALNIAFEAIDKDSADTTQLSPPPSTAITATHTDAAAAASTNIVPLKSLPNTETMACVDGDFHNIDDDLIEQKIPGCAEDKSELKHVEPTMAGDLDTNAEEIYEIIEDVSQPKPLKSALKSPKKENRVAKPEANTTNVEPYYEVPQRNPIPLYENVDVFFAAGKGNQIGVSLEPPKIKPPPPPIESELESDDGQDEAVVDGEVVTPEENLKRMNSTKRIKKQIRTQRSSFLGIQGGQDDDELELKLSVAPPPDMSALVEEERRLEKQFLKTYDGIVERSDSGVSESHSRQSSEAFTGSSEEHEDRSKDLEDGGRQGEWTDDVRMQNIEEQIREQEEVLRVERELLQIEQEELKRQRANLLLRENHARKELTNRLSLQDINQSLAVNGRSPPQLPQPVSSATSSSTECSSFQAFDMGTPSMSGPVGYRQSMPDLQSSIVAESHGNNHSGLVHSNGHVGLTPPAKPSRHFGYANNGNNDNGTYQNVFPHKAPSTNDLCEEFVQLRDHDSNGADRTQQYIGNMSRHTLHALSAVPKPKLTDVWVQQQAVGRKLEQDGNKYFPVQRMPQLAARKTDAPKGLGYGKHWLIQEAEQRRLDQQRGVRPTPNPQNWPIKSAGHLHRKSMPDISSEKKPLPDAVINTITQRLSRMSVGNVVDKKRFDANPAIINSNPSLDDGLTTEHIDTRMHRNQEQVLSVSGKKKCSHCNYELGRGAAMIVESLRLFYHIDCFKCCVCLIRLGDGLNGTDVRVRNHKLHCQNCYSSDDGIKFSCV